MTVACIIKLKYYHPSQGYSLALARSVNYEHKVLVSYNHERFIVQTTDCFLRTHQLALNRARTLKSVSTVVYTEGQFTHLTKTA
jgi:hypothetical protein